MKSSIYFRLIAMGCSVLISLWHRPLAAQESQFSFSLQTSTYTEARARNQPGIIDSGTVLSRSVARGDEQSQCNAGEQNISNSEARAEIKNGSNQPERIGYTLLTKAAAAGGHFVRCVSCPGICIGRLPEDANAQALARANATVDIRFSPTARQLPYKLNLQMSPSAPTGASSKVWFRLLDSAGAILREGALLNGEISLEGGPGKEYRLITESVASTSSTGAGFEESGSETSVGVGMSLAALMENTDDSDDALIKDGKFTRRYQPVGALLLGNDGLCTGTLIARNVVLTAAHCVYWYQDRIRDISFIVGFDHKDQANPRSGVEKVYYPRYDRDTLQFHEQGLLNDIAILILKKEFDSFYGLPDDSDTSPQPHLEDLVGQKALLTFVGFGKKTETGLVGGEGTKRELSVPIVAVDSAKFHYQNQGKSTCKGDSGGPALLQWNDSFVVVGVASDGNCFDRGSHVYVKKYVKLIQSWIKAYQAEIAQPAGSAPVPAG